MKKLVTSDLFVSHILRTIEKRHIYIKLRVTDDGTLISFGRDKKDSCTINSDFHGSYLVFEESDIEIWPESVDLVNLQNAILSIYPDFILTLFDNNQVLMIEAKVNVPFPERPVSLEHMNLKFCECIYNHPRTILYVENDLFNSNRYLPAFIMNEVFGLYLMEENYCDEMSDEFGIILKEIESLDRNQFDVYRLQETQFSIVFEITNKLL